MAYVADMPHGSEHEAASRPLDRSEADEIAQVMRLFASASRLRLLGALMVGSRTVEQLAAEVGMEQSAVSHQLRLMREAKLVAATREGRHARYRLHDHHVTELLAAVRHHLEHVHAPTGPEVPEAFEPLRHA